MTAQDHDRTLEQELADGRSESTPVIALSTVIVVIAVLVVVALGLATLAYLLA
jgi:hypothetical protein